MNRTGVWIVGAKGGVATTLIVGALAMARGGNDSHGMITTSPLFDGIPIPSVEGLVFGGHEIRQLSLVENAEQIQRENGTIPPELIATIRSDLATVDARLRPGVVYHSGSAIEALVDDPQSQPAGTASDVVARIAGDLRSFRETESLDRVVVVNLASTEPSPVPHPQHQTAEGIRSLVDADERSALIASTLYSVAAAKEGCPYINFTPSPGALLPGVAELFLEAGLPFMGSDGKTGETLVKSALAPMFKYRNLRVLSWQGYNMLGDRDGEVLASSENKEAKVESKDQLLRNYLGYPLHSQVSIDYVPSLGDLKTAWDFIHFQGFLGFKMSLQFTWQGCDSILAAPIVLDLIRLITLSHERGESGPQAHLSAFFKSPHGVEEHDLHMQFHLLLEYVARLRGEEHPAS